MLKSLLRTTCSVEASETVHQPEGNLLMQLRIERAKSAKLAHALDYYAKDRDFWRRKTCETEAANEKLADMLRRCRCKAEFE